MKWIAAAVLLLSSSLAFADHSRICGIACCNSRRDLLVTLKKAPWQRSEEEETMSILLSHELCPNLPAEQAESDECTRGLQEFYNRECLD